MSVFSSLYVARTGMQVYERNMQTIGDNIANINTIGYKASRGIFADIFYNTLLSGTSQVGIGSQVLSIQRITTQGVLLGTNISTDLGIKGSGYFVVRGDGPAGVDSYFTRAGQMEIDAEGKLVNPQGMRVQGYAANSQGQILPSLGDLTIGNRESSPTVSENVTFNLNLNASEVVGPGFDTLNPATTSQFSTSISVYDSLGEEHQIDVYFEKTAANEWTFHATLDDGELTNGTPGVLTEIATGTLNFTTEGILESQVQVGGTVNFSDAEPQTLSFSFGDDINSGGNGSGTTQYSAISAIEEAYQDGFSSGRLQFLVIEPDGKVVGTFSNGNVQAIGQIATALFLSPGNLEGMGDNLFRESIESGAPAIGAPNSGGRGQVFSGALEQSNVDLTNEFTQMIITQRAFQASSRTITTADEMLAEVVNLKR